MANITSGYLDVMFDGNRQTVIHDVYQYDHGIVLRVRGVPIDEMWQLQFGYRGDAESVTVIGVIEDDAVTAQIPDYL